ncbi:DNA-binding transcriptional MerR regulator [Breznakia blatticola]|uniref:DNA-binding transcriptional MerR regulator n=2 Tax=Erysipelotrichaceae TaxID=128827 RepID=A0A4R7ZVH0_9FIRM|nr:DNA-binding transcriptional MerR regulator [Breznakia sp. PH1-1]MDH6404853.1 DNA-binding transcriptional MerR regulator [Breznakia sp. PF1-11]MDH6412568.1 DNA-binding transcriptional MerR regulator [Breznakia sp. PFB1-11]MDH6414956.1 DNA-binding transcriptional MerR regulator [Breznakia sp. PFB1-14]MDH6417267.1 DNA-binding transcriptional MerR regulator [Breznakia sp. PFB1-4]MDH6419601.1 DNA-binding transcriptional MerR regulator [Breznakia sp. PFB1-12]MDH6474661.1 DNA-binding transcriptio
MYTVYMKKYLSIGEMAKLNDVSIQRLRYYDSIGMLSPAYVDPDSKYRYYEKEQSGILLQIQRLQYIGFSLDEIKVMLKSSNLDYEAILKEKRERLEKELDTIKNKQEKLADYERSLKTPSSKVCDLTLPYLRFACIDVKLKNVLDMDIEDYVDYRAALRTFIKKHGLSRSTISKMVIFNEGEKAHIMVPVSASLEVDCAYPVYTYQNVKLKEMHCSTKEQIQTIESLYKKVKHPGICIIQRLPSLHRNRKDSCIVQLQVLDK